MDVVEHVEEFKLRAASALRRYNRGSKKRHKKQIAFHTDTSSSRWVFGGNRTGKTECGAVEAVYWATGAHPYREITTATDGWVVSVSLQVQRDVAQAKVLKYLDPSQIVEVVMKSGSRGNPSSGVIDFVTVKNRFGTTSKIGFKSCDQGREKFQGTSLDWVWFDEEPPEDVYQECLLRTLDRGGAVWGTMTPLKGRTWLYDKIFLDPETHSIHQMSWTDNPFLRKAYLDKMRRTLSEDELESREHGRFADGSGVVFREFGEDNIIEPEPVDLNWDITLAIDPGYTSPTAAVWVVHNKDEIRVIADYAVTGKQVDEHAKALRDRTSELGLNVDDLRVLIDTASNQKQLGNPESVAQQFRQHGLMVDSAVNRERMTGVMHMKSLFRNADGIRRLIVYRNCTNLIRELRMLSWGADGTPEKRGDHCIDALRYAIMTPRTTRTRASPVWVQPSHKDQMARRNQWMQKC